MNIKEDMAAIGGRMKIARIRADVTQEEAAKAADVTRSTVSNWEAGRNMPCLVQFRELMALYVESPYRVLVGRPMFGLTREEVAEIMRLMDGASPALRRKVDLMVALQTRDLD